MVLEATVVCVDNSDFMINGDYKPTRLQAQAEAVNLLAGAKTGSNPENTVGVLSLAGTRGPKVSADGRDAFRSLSFLAAATPFVRPRRPPRSPPHIPFVIAARITRSFSTKRRVLTRHLRLASQVLATPTPDLGRVLSCMQEIKPEGSVSLIQGVQIAQLALKHRQNKNQRQRIVAFIGSPLEEEEKALVKVAKKLKKNNVSIDIVSFGEEAAELNAGKLDAFLAAVNSNDSSHLVTVPPGSNVLSDVLLSTPVFMGDEDSGAGMGSGGGAMGGGGASDFEFGVDPNLDPELALALRVSMEEERARQEAQAQREREQQQQEGGTSAEGAAAAAADDGKEAKEENKGQAGTAEGEKAAEGSKEVEMKAEDAKDEVKEDADGDVEMTDEAILQQALAMSLAGGEDPTTPAPQVGKDEDQATPQAHEKAEGGTSSNLGAMLEDKTFVTSVLSNLPGVDVSDANVQQVLSALKEKQSIKKKEDDDEDEAKDE